MHAITSLCARCLHARHRGCNLSSPTNNPKNQNFEKMKKTPGDTIILHLCTTNDDHIMYGSWDMERERQFFFVILDLFLTIYPPLTLTTQKIKILKKMKKMLRNIVIIRKRTINDNHMMYGSWDMKRDRVFCHSGTLFVLLRQ